MTPDRAKSPLTGVPSDAAARLYIGDVMHARLKPFGHRFNYRVMSLLIDLNRLDEADQQSRLFSVNRASLYSFHESDHGPKDGSSLASHVRRQADRHRIDLAGGKILLLCYPRLLGFVFNPLSVYYAFDAQGALRLLIYEVRNTFGQIHSYVRPVRENDVSPAGVRQTQDKTFYVSPFIEMAMRYHFRLTLPADRIALRILETDADGPLLAATFSGHRRELTSANLLRAFVALPLVTVKIVTAIHWEALRLWLKGARLVPRTNKETAAPHGQGNAARRAR